jgi:uncharacterized protein involved in type VI secretion and phage assembly
MISGLVVGIVLDNVDPDKMHRVLVKYPVDSEDELKSSWCRMMTPMGGKLRGLVMLPDIGTEVLMMMAYKTMSAYIVGAVYNGTDDKPEPYHNDDSNDDKRVFWSRNDHMVIFDDTSGAESVSIGAKAPTRLDVKSGPIYQVLDSSQKTITEYCGKDTIWEAVETISFKCKDFKMDASMTVAMGAKTAILASGTSTTIKSTTTQVYKATAVAVNPAAPCSAPSPALPTPAHKHPPTS